MKLGSVITLLPPPEGADPLIWRVDKAASLGLTCLGVFVREEWKAPDYLRKVAEHAARKGVELRLGTGGNFYLHGAQARAEIDRVAEQVIHARRHLGTTFSSLAPGPMLTHHRFAAGPPLSERKARLSENLGTLADAVRGEGITLGLENHCDWRGHEVVEIVRGANRTNLMMQIDTGNAFSVFEEPVDCARAMGPWVVSSHLKDVHVTPFATGDMRGSRAVSVPLGQGHVDNVEICRILERESPDPASLTLLIEPFYVPEGVDPLKFLEESVAWGKVHLAEFLN